MQKSYTSIVGNDKPVDTAKREPGIGERLRRKQNKAMKEPNPAKNDADATGTTSPRRSDAKKGSNVGPSTPPSSSPHRSTLPSRRTGITYPVCKMTL